MEYSTRKSWEEISETGIKYSVGSLYDRFGQMEDPRKAKGKRYSLVTLMVIIFLAKLCGKDNPVEIADWAQNHATKIAQLLGLKRNWMPHHNTIRRVFQNVISVEELEQVMEDYHQIQSMEECEVLSIDGKALRGTYKAGQERSKYVLSLYEGVTQRVKAQESIESKENEIVAAPKLIQKADIVGKIITGDAMHTQKGISAQILAAQGQYLWPVKENQQRLYQDIQKLFEKETPKPGFGKISTDFQAAKKCNYGHGRLETRTIQTSEMLNEYLDWPGVKQVYRLERKFQWIRQGEVYKTSTEVEFGITSLSREKASPEKVLQVRRQYWQIETGLHYRRDVTFNEDATRMTIGQAATILSIIHNLVLGLIKQAGFSNSAKGRRWFEGHIEEAFALIASPKSLS